MSGRGGAGKSVEGGAGKGGKDGAAEGAEGRSVDRASGRGSFELQVHPAGSHGRVHYFRLTRAHLTAWSVVGLAYLFLLAATTGLAPGVVAGLFGSEEYRALTAERAQLGERLVALVGRLDQLRTRGEDLESRVRKVAVAYDIAPAGGAAAPAAAGQGRARGAAEGAPPGGGAVAESIYDGTVRQGERLRGRIHGEIGDIETALAEVRAFESAHPDQARFTPAACPLRGERFVLTAPFGRQRSGFSRDLAFHSGIDLAAPRGTPIVAPADGVVLFAGVYPLARSPAWWRYGNLVAVGHGDRFLTLYGHCGELKVAARRAVRRGELLAVVGSSGWSLSPHLHFEIRRRGPGGALQPVDPLLYILDRRWPDEDRLLARHARPGEAAADAEPLPPGLDRLPGR